MRNMPGLFTLENVAQDVRYALRGMRKNPGFRRCNEAPLEHPAEARCGRHW
jgi:hypothetical protein